MGKKRRKLMSPKYARKAASFRKAVNVLKTENVNPANQVVSVPVTEDIVESTEQQSEEPRLFTEEPAELSKPTPNALKKTATSKPAKARSARKVSTPKKASTSGSSDKNTKTKKTTRRRTTRKASA